MSVLKPNDIISQSSADFDRVIEGARVALAAIPWMEKAFGRAFELPERVDGNIYKYPHAYIGRGEYFNLMPNDQYKSYSWMIGRGAADSIDEDQQGFSLQTKFTKRLDVHGFFNLKQIKPTANSIYTEELVTDMIEALSKVRGIVVNQYFCENIFDVYSDYTLKQIDRDLLYYPFAGVRITCTASFNNRVC